MIKAVIKFFLLTLICLTMMVVTFVPWALRLETLRARLVHVTFSLASRLLGIRVHIKGEMSTHRPLMVVSNHSSYADIFVLGRAAPVAFTPKSDIKYWPIVGWCCMLSNCVFVERKPSKMAKISHEIHRKLNAGQVICLFAEGTTGNGTDMKPFKSGFFSLAEGEAGLQVQPATIIYTHRDGKALTPKGREEIAWFGEETQLLPHLLRFLSFSSVNATLHFHEPVTMESFDNRKALCSYVEAQVKDGLEKGLVLRKEL